jgi:radical SAM protein with 4Fe4S-binding SPASM domain
MNTVTRGERRSANQGVSSRLRRTALKLAKDANSGLLNAAYRANLARIPAGPEGLMVEPSSLCNLRCPLCPTGMRVTKRDRPSLSFEQFKAALGIYRYTLRYITFWNYGEPLLNRELPEMVGYASRYAIETQISTNGAFLDDEWASRLMEAGLTRLIVSIDTPHEALYARYRVRGDYQQVIRNVRGAVARKQTLRARTAIVLQYMLMSGTEDLDAIVAQGEDLGADEVVVKSIGIGSFVARPTQQHFTLMPRNPDYQRYPLPELRAKEPWGDTRCSYVWRRMVLCSDGTCLPCCRDQTSEFELGRTTDGTTLARVWNSPAYARFRRDIRRTMQTARMCQRCPELTKPNVDPGLVYAGSEDETTTTFALDVRARR